MWLVLVVGADRVGLPAHAAARAATSTRWARNPPAAVLAGIPVVRRVIGATSICGACAGAAGVLFMARLGGVDANAGTGYELPVIAACVVGGVNIFGGSGTVVGALLGAMLLRSIGFSLSALSIPEFWQQAVNGALLLLAISADRLRHASAATALRPPERSMNASSSHFEWDKVRAGARRPRR